MKSFILLASSLIVLFSPTSSVWARPSAKFNPASTWADFEEGDELILSHDLKISSHFQLKAGSRFILGSLTTLDPVPVYALTLNAMDCNESNDPTPVDMTILENTYGFEWKKTCTANFYVEFKDLNQRSYFSRTEP